MPWHRDTGKPSAHWGLLFLATTGLFGALMLEGYASHDGGGTAPPGQPNSAGFEATLTEPLVRVDGDHLKTYRMPGRTVALTFDDGPDPTWTPRVLDSLRSRGVKATFFVVGSRVNEHPELVRRILAEGHELGLHSFSHRDLTSAPPWQRRLELTLTRNAIAGATGRDVRLYRPPYSGTPALADPGSMAVIRQAGRDGYLTVLADLDTHDWLRPGHEAIASAGAPPGDRGAIVAMHDGGGDREQTFIALDILIPALTGRQYRFLTVSGAMSEVAPDRPTAATGAKAAETVPGWAFAMAQRVAGWVAYAIFLLLVLATGLAITRMIIQAGCAWMHARRRHARPGGTFLPPVSVIVPAHNEAANIAATVSSLLATGYPDLDVVVVDDGSTDGTADIVEALGLVGVRVVRQRNAGKAAALRTGLAQARHDLLVMIDGDTIVEPETLSLLVQPLRDEAVGAVAGNTKVANRSGILGRWQHLEYVVTFNLDRRVFEMAECMPTVPGALGAFRRAAIVAAGQVNADTLAEDTDLTMAICRAGWRVVYEDRACAWTEAPGTWQGLWRQRYRWCYGTMQAMWKHRAALRESGASGKFGRRGLGYLLLFQVLQPLLAPLVDVYLLYTLAFQPLSWTAVVWLGLHAAQLAVAAYAFRLDREQMAPLWSFLLQQLAYRQLIYLVVIQSATTALVGARLRWQQPARTGHAAALLDGSPAARSHLVMRQMRGIKYQDPLWARLTVWTGILLLVLSGTGFAGKRLLVQRYQAAHHSDLLGESATYDGGALNVLLMGVDWRRDENGPIRADTVMVAHVPRTMDRLYLFSLPGDTLVDIPAFPENGYRGGRDRLNAAFTYGVGERQDRAAGGRLLARTAAKVTGLGGFDAAALIDFYGFMGVVEELGGVDLCIDADTYSAASGVTFRRGCQRLDAASALDYVRQRNALAAGDYDRQRHQQQLIKALVTEAKAQHLLTDPAKLDRVVRAAGGALTVTTGSVSPVEFVLGLPDVSPERVTLIRTAGHSLSVPQLGYQGEVLEPLAFELFRAVRDERVEQFLSDHPDLVHSGA